MARDQEKDLVEMVAAAKPPVAKIISFSKYKYQLQQKQQEDRKKSKISDIKELRMTPVMAQGDFDQRVKRAQEFLEDGDKVRFIVKFKGRMVARKDLGERILTNAFEKLAEISSVEITPKMMGKMMMAQLMPAKKRVKSEQ
jgi:translation initiation factor IF-3